MKKKKGFSKFVTGILICLILLIVGVCLVIAGRGRDEKPSPGPNAKWSVKIDDKSYKELSGSVKATGFSVDGTKMKYVVPLSSKGDFYQATIKVVNDGDFDAKLDSVSIGGLTDEQKKSIQHTVKFGEYAFLNDAKNVDLFLNAGKSKTIEIFVLVNEPINGVNSYTLEFTLNFIKDK